MDRSAPDLHLSPTCDHPDCDGKAIGKAGLDWYCRAHRPGFRPSVVVAPVIVADAPTPKVAAVKRQPERRVDRRKRTNRPHNPTIHKPLPLVLRVNADQHPDLCRIAGCVARLVARGMCDPHGRRARAAGMMDALGLPVDTEAMRRGKLGWRKPTG